MTTKKEVDNEKAQLLKNARLTMETPFGKAFIMEIVKRSGMFDDTFRIESERADCFMSGRKSIGHEIMELINYAMIDGYYEVKRMQIEQIKKRSRVDDYFPGARG